MKQISTGLFILLISLVGQLTSAQSKSCFLVKKMNFKGVPTDIDFSSMQQDDDGFLWLGGLSGLYRYDATKTTRFLRDPSDTNSLTHSYASTLTKDSKGNIWIGTFGGFMNRYNRVTGKMERIEPAVKNPERNVVRKIIFSRDGNIIAATAQAIYKISPAGKVKDSILIPTAEPMKNAAIADVIEHEDDQYLVAASTGFFIVDWKKRQMLPAGFLPQGQPYTCIEKDSKGNFWIGSASNFFIVRKNLTLETQTNFLYNTSLVGRVTCMTLDETGMMWIGSANGLFVADEKTITQVTANNDSLTDVTCLYIDKQQTVWVQSANGLHQVFKPAVIFKTIPGIQAPAKNQSIQSLLEEKPGSWNIGTRHGLYNYSFTSGAVNEIVITGNKENKPWIGAQFIDRSKGYWVGTFGQGVFYRETGSKTLKQFIHDPGNEKSLSFNNIVALGEDKTGNIWMGAFNSGNQSGKNGLSYYDPLSKMICRVNGTSSEASFKSFATSQIEKDESEHMWIGSWDIGVTKYVGTGISKEQEKFFNYSEVSPDPQKISNNVVSCVRPGSNNKIWIGTVSGGLNLLDTKTNRNRWFTIKDGLASNLIYRIEEDNNGMIWMSTDNGISRLDPTTKSFINYNTTTGLATNNFAFLTSMKCADGTIAFGTNDGQVIYFNPSTSKNLVNKQQVVITDIKIFNKSLETGPSSLLQKASYITDTLYLDYDHTVISFELSNMDFINPEIFTYAYKLEGFDKEWTYITDKNSITYTNLDPGTYTLQVKNADHYGTWNEIPTKLFLIVKSPFWQTWWFISLLVLSAAGLLYLFLRNRLHQKLQIYRVRNRLHRDLHDDVGATLSSVKAYAEILQSNPNNPVIAELIKDNSADMIDRLEVIAWATNPKHDNFKSLKDLMVKFAAPICHSKNIKWHLDNENINDDMLMSGEVRQNIFLVFKEAINNLIKYADATNCNTQLSIHNNHFSMHVMDNGNGYDGTTKGSGNGWKNMKKRTEELGGTLIINSSALKGTEIKMHLPYPFKIPNTWDS